MGHRPRPRRSGCSRRMRGPSDARVRRRREPARPVRRRAPCSMPPTGGASDPPALRRVRPLRSTPSRPQEPDCPRPRCSGSRRGRTPFLPRRSGWRTATLRPGYRGRRSFLDPYGAGFRDHRRRAPRRSLRREPTSVRLLTRVLRCSSECFPEIAHAFSSSNQP